MEQNTNEKPVKANNDAKRFWWFAAILLLAEAAGIWFGLHPYYRFLSAVFAAVAVVAVLKKNWWWWICTAVQLAIVAILWSFGPAGYRYASAVPLLLSVICVILRFGKRWLRVAAFALSVFGILALSAVELPIVSAAQAEADTSASYVVVLGAAVYGKDPSIALKNRLNRAIAYLHANPSAKVVVSGGQGEGEDISEAACMQTYLKAKGIDASRILSEEHSTSTMENLAFSKAVIEQDGGDPQKIAIVSSAYHLYRAQSMASSLGMQAIGVASSDGYPLYMCGMYLREALGVVKMWLFGALEQKTCLASVYAAVR